uniref:Guanylate cyclase n=1 Tax=Pseudonaja textilis TaxID=8673 RepID=A0A670ZHI0_PSETE
MADKHVFSSYVRWPPWIFSNLHRVILLRMVLILSPACCPALKIGLVGPWSFDSFFSNALPEVATQLAVERIKKDPSLAAVPPLDYVLLEEDLQTWKAMARFVESSKNRSAFVGPLNPSYCEAASLLAQGWNQPMLSWACLNDDLDKPRNQPWLIRTLPSAATILLTVLRYFNWAHVGIVSSKGGFWVDVAHKLASVLRSRGLPVALVTSTGTEAEKVEEAWTKVEAAGNIKALLLCMPSALIGGEDQAAFLKKAQELGLADGRYVFVPYDTLFYRLPYGNHSHFLLENDGAFRKAYDAVLTITLQSGEWNFYEAFRAAKEKGEIKANLEPEQVTPLFGTIYDAVYLLAKVLAKIARPQTSELFGTNLIHHVRNLDFAGFSHRIQVDSKGQPLARYVILDTDGKESHLYPTYLLAASSGMIQPLGRAIHFPGGTSPPVDSACWFEPDVLCKRDDACWSFKTSLPSAKYVPFTAGFCPLEGGAVTLQPYSRVARAAAAALSYEQPYTCTRTWHRLLENLLIAAVLLFFLICLQMRELHHENVNPFLGLLSDTGLSAVVMDFCSRGSLQDLLQNMDIKLDWMFKSSLLLDLIKGMKYLHNLDISHGRLKSRNCVVDGRFVLKITDYGYGELMAAQGISQDPASAEGISLSLSLSFSSFLHLSLPEVNPKGTLQGDVFSFAIILQEVILRGPPYCTMELTAEEIISKLKHPMMLFRPSVALENTPLEYIQLMKQCWSEVPNRRPTFDKIFERAINKGKQTNIVDSMLRMLESYSSNLEELIRERTEELEVEKQKTDRLLSQMLPSPVAKTLIRGASVEPEYFDEVTIYFSDIIGFTTMSALCEPIEIVDLLNDLYTLFDAVIGHHDVYKVETIGDAYMVASGLPQRNGHRHAAEVANMSLDILSSVGAFKVKHIPDLPVKIRMGLHSGPCAAGVVGLTMPRYCLFGDTVNTASRIESTGLPYRIHISQNTMRILHNLKEGYKINFRGKTELKGKGLQDTYWLVGKKGFTKTLPQPPEIKAGQPWQETITREIKAAMKVSRRKFMDQHN